MIEQGMSIPVNFDDIDPNYTVGILEEGYKTCIVPVLSKQEEKVTKDFTRFGWEWVWTLENEERTHCKIKFRKPLEGEARQKWLEPKAQAEADARMDEWANYNFSRDESDRISETRDLDRDEDV